MNNTQSLKSIILLLLPLLLFAVLVVPYSYINSEYLVDIFGCGCPQIDEYGNMVENTFNANDVTAIFWFCVTIVVTVISGFISVKLPKLWMRLVYTAAMFGISLVITYSLIQSMMLN